MRAPNRPTNTKDLLGFLFFMRERLEGFDEEALELIEAFADRYRELDEWKLTNGRVKTFTALEPCFARQGPGVVLSIGIVRVSVRLWSVPYVQPDSPMPGKVTWLEPRNMTKVSKAKQWKEWCKQMGLCGHSASEWSRRDFEGVADVG